MALPLSDGPHTSGPRFLDEVILVMPGDDSQDPCPVPPAPGGALGGGRAQLCSASGRRCQ